MNIIWRKINEFNGKIRTKRNARRTNNTTTVTTPTYFGTDDEFYVGVSSDKATTVYLPANARDGKIIIIKAEMKPPLGCRKINILTTDGSTIDGYSDASITVSHGVKVLIRNCNNWYIIS